MLFRSFRDWLVFFRRECSKCLKFLHHSAYTDRYHKFRTPGFYKEVDPFTGRSTGRALDSTNEYIHASVRTRYKLDGPGVADKGYYDPRALTDNYKLVVDYGPTANSKSSEPEIIWKLKWKDDEGAAPRLPEAPLFSIERDLCRKDPKTYDYIRKPPATGRDKKRKSQRPVSAGFDSRGAGADTVIAGPSSKTDIAILSPRIRGMAERVSSRTKSEVVVRVVLGV